MPIDRKTGKSRRYTKEELEFIRKEYPVTSTKEIAEALSVDIINMTPNAVRSKAIKMKIKKIGTSIKNEISENEKYCPHCKNVKLKSEFHRKRKEDDNSINAYCKPCASEIARNNRYENRLKEKMNVEEYENTKKILHAEGNTHLCRKCNSMKPANKYEIDYKAKKLINICRECRKIQQEQNKMRRILDGKEW